MQKKLLFIWLFLAAGIALPQDNSQTDIPSGGKFARLEQVFAYINQLNPNDYQFFLDSLKKNRSTDFFALRMAYTKTVKFAPVSEQTIDLFNLAGSLIEKNRLNDALVELKKILVYDYVNIKAHLLQGYLYNRLKDSVNSQYHNLVYEELLKSIMDYGDGKNPETAFIVITIDEEYAFLTAAGYSIVEQESLIREGHFFDRIRVCHAKTDREFWMYFCTDIPALKMGLQK